MASASLSSAGLNPRSRTAAMTACLVGVALAGDEPLDGADGHALVGDRVLLAPGRQRGEQTAMDMRGVGAEMSAYFFVMDDADAGCVLRHAVEPGAEAQVANAAAVVAARAERHRAAEDLTVSRAQCPAGGGREIEGHQGWPRPRSDDRSAGF